MSPVYIDIHIHTSEDPNNLNENYDTKTLVSKVKELACDRDVVLSLTDHNTINKKEASCICVCQQRFKIDPLIQ